MGFRRYVAPTAREALERIRKELGVDAVILSNRRTGPNRVEIIAAAQGQMDALVDDFVPAPAVPAPQAAPTRKAARPAVAPPAARRTAPETFQEFIRRQSSEPAARTEGVAMYHDIARESEELPLAPMRQTPASVRSPNAPAARSPVAPLPVRAIRPDFADPPEPAVFRRRPSRSLSWEGADAAAADALPEPISIAPPSRPAAQRPPAARDADIVPIVQQMVPPMVEHMVQKMVEQKMQEMAPQVLRQHAPAPQRAPAAQPAPTLAQHAPVAMQATLEPTPQAEMQAEMQAAQQAALQAALQAELLAAQHAELKAAQEAAQQAAEKAAQQAAEQAEMKAMQEAAQQAEIKAAQEAARHAAQQAEMKAAQEAARHAAQQAEMKAAQEAAQHAARQVELKAAQEAARHAAQQAEMKAAQEAARQAAEQAQRQAAQQAAQKAAQQAEVQAAQEAARQAARLAAKTLAPSALPPLPAGEGRGEGHRPATTLTPASLPQGEKGVSAVPVEPMFAQGVAIVAPLPDSRLMAELQFLRSALTDRITKLEDRLANAEPQADAPPAAVTPAAAPPTVGSVAAPTPSVAQSPVRRQVMTRLIMSGFSPQLSRRVGEAAPATLDAKGTDAWLQQVIGQYVRCPAEVDNPLLNPGAVALVGPTGVGKTTTLAKIAARFVVRHGAGALGLITLDSYRMGAHEQLRGYGRILGVPVHTAHDAASLRELLASLQGRRQVLIDTCGMSQRDPRLGEMLAMLDAVRFADRPVKRVLLINAASHAETLDEVARGWRVESANGAVLTKIDEAARIGGALDALMRFQTPLLGLTNGQRVPEDWHPGNPPLLAHIALKPFGAAFSLDSDELQSLSRTGALIA